MSDPFPPDDAQALVDGYYARHYEAVHGSGCLGGAAAVLHRRLERRRPPSSHFPLTVELGAGRFEHLPFVEHRWDRYIATDIRVPRHHPMYQSLERGAGPRGLEFEQMDAQHLDLESGSVDRVVATCLIIHLPDPLAAVREWQRVTRPDGVIDILVPCDPGMASRSFRRIVSRRAARKQGVPAGEYELVNAIEHLNPVSRVLTLARHAITEDRALEVDYFPFGAIPSWNVNAFAVLSIGPR